MKIVVKKAECLTDWYTIVRAEHDGREWWEDVGPNTRRFMTSERVSPEACIEGSAFEMLALADAIRRGGQAHFKRCAVFCADDGVYFESPKNSAKPVLIPFEDADAFAAQVESLLKPPLCELPEKAVEE